jgi:hypothetical protein
LIDIKNSNVRRGNQGSQQELNQFRNWTTLLQSIGLRAIILYDRDPQVETVDVSTLGFGTNYRGKQQVWTFDFRPDQAAAFARKDDPIALLKEDLDKIPIILNLTETINTEQAVFDLTDVKFKNTVVKAL